MRTLSAVTLVAARRILSERLDKMTEEMVGPRAARDLTDVMLDLIEHQIGRKLNARALLESLT
jgi:hypothetical protein